MTILFPLLARWMRRVVDTWRAFFTCDHGQAGRVLALERELAWLAQECRCAKAHERERIACRLHDEVGQQLVLIRLKLGELRAADGPAQAQLLDAVVLLVAQAAEATRTLTFDLGASLASAGLLTELQGIAGALSRRSGIAVTVDVPQPGLDLPEPQRSVACRTVNEFCLNVLKHARARRVSIASQVEAGCLCVDVQDDGDGLSEPSPRSWRARPDGGFGLASAQAQLRALGGDLQLRSRPGCGTSARLKLPLTQA